MEMSNSNLNDKTLFEINSCDEILDCTITPPPSPSEKLFINSPTVNIQMGPQHFDL